MFIQGHNNSFSTWHCHAVIYSAGCPFPDSSLSKLHGNVSRNLISHLVKAQEVGPELEVVTGSIPQPWHRIPRARVGSDESVSRTVRHRNTGIQK